MDSVKIKNKHLSNQTIVDPLLKSLNEFVLGLKQKIMEHGIQKTVEIEKLIKENYEGFQDAKSKSTFYGG